MLPQQSGGFGVATVDARSKAVTFLSSKSNQQAGLELFVPLNFIFSSSPGPKIHVIQ